MIHKLTFSNFYSFRNEVSFSFLVNKNAPCTDSYYKNSYDDRISKIMTVVGANASGKTNLLKSLVFLKWFISDSFSGLRPEDKIKVDFEPFLFCTKNKTSKFNIIFEISNDIYEYDLELTSEKVIKEILSIKKRDTDRMNVLFKRELLEDGKNYKTSLSKMKLPSNFSKMLRPNSSLLSTAKQIDNMYAIKIVNYFSHIKSNIDDLSKKENEINSIFNVTEFLYKNPKMLEMTEKFLKRFDLGLSKFTIEKINGSDDEPVFFPLAHHKFIDTDKEGILPMFRESGGTRNLLVLLKDVLSTLNTGGIVVFDELDNNLHPLMIPELINLFKSRNYNIHNAQILFSTHNPQILNELDKQQIVIVEKNENISDAWVLSSMSGLRNDDNYSSKYLAGVYGGVPRF